MRDHVIHYDIESQLPVSALNATVRAGLKDAVKAHFVRETDYELRHIKNCTLADGAVGGQGRSRRASASTIRATVYLHGSETTAAEVERAVKKISAAVQGSADSGSLKSGGLAFTVADVTMPAASGQLSGGDSTTAANQATSAPKLAGASDDVVPGGQADNTVVVALLVVASVVLVLVVVSGLAVYTAKRGNRSKTAVGIAPHYEDEGQGQGTVEAPSDTPRQAFANGKAAAMPRGSVLPPIGRAPPTKKLSSMAGAVVTKAVFSWDPAKLKRADPKLVAAKKALQWRNKHLLTQLANARLENELHDAKFVQVEALNAKEALERELEIVQLQNAAGAQADQRMRAGLRQRVPDAPVLLPPTLHKQHTETLLTIHNLDSAVVQSQVEEQRSQKHAETQERVVQRVKSASMGRIQRANSGLGQTAASPVPSPTLPGMANNTGAGGSTA